MCAHCRSSPHTQVSPASSCSYALEDSLLTPESLPVIASTTFLFPLKQSVSENHHASYRAAAASDAEVCLGGAHSQGHPDTLPRGGLVRDARPGERQAGEAAAAAAREQGGPAAAVRG